jgi:hypothetical protein
MAATRENDTHNWYGLIMAAQAQGYRVTRDDDGLWWIITPKRPRRASETLGAYRTERDAWHDAAGIAYITK